VLELARMRTCKRSLEVASEETPGKVKVCTPVPVCAAEVASVVTTAQLELTRTSWAL
jgi:hypothetical protein